MLAQLNPFLKNSFLYFHKKLYNFCLAEILSIIRLSNLKRSIDVTSLEEVTNIQVLLPKPIADKMY